MVYVNTRMMPEGFRGLSPKYYQRLGVQANLPLVWVISLIHRFMCLRYDGHHDVMLEIPICIS